MVRRMPWMMTVNGERFNGWKGLRLYKACGVRCGRSQTLQFSVMSLVCTSHKMNGLIMVLHRVTQSRTQYTHLSKNMIFQICEMVMDRVRVGYAQI